MSVDEFVAQIVTQLPTVAGMVVALAFMWRVCERLLGFVERYLAICKRFEQSLDKDEKSD